MRHPFRLSDSPIAELKCQLAGIARAGIDRRLTTVNVTERAPQSLIPMENAMSETMTQRFRVLRRKTMRWFQPPICDIVRERPVHRDERLTQVRSFTALRP